MSRLDRINSSQRTNFDPFAGQNEFDYSAWEGKKARIKLMSVTWESDLKNAINWESFGVEGRDEYFQQEHPDELIIDTSWNFKTAMQYSPSEGRFIGEIEISEPIENIRQYNYLYLQDYENPVPYTTGKKVTDYFYFITAANTFSPNKTTLYLSVDAWTMFFNDAEIMALFLNRGHWPHKQVTAESFLNNPLDAEVDLTFLEDDLPSVKPMMSYTNLLSLTGSEPRVCIATTAAFENDRLGTQWSPDTYTWGDPFDGEYAGGDSWNLGYTPSLWFHDPFSPGDLDDNNQGGIGAHSQYAPHAWITETSDKEQTPGSVRVYSTDINTFNNFINSARAHLPQIFETIQAFYVLPSALIEEGEEFSLASVDGAVGNDMKFKRVFPQPQAQKLADVEITNELFNYNENLSDFAKAYTSQFAQIKISDFSGNSAMLGVEELAGDLEFYGRASSTFPYMKVQAFLNGIGGNREKTYAIKPLHEMEAQGFDSRWSEFLWNLDIPTFTVAVSQKEINGAYSINKWRNTVNNAYIDAENSMREADISKKQGDETLAQKREEFNVSHEINERATNHNLVVGNLTNSHNKSLRNMEHVLKYGETEGDWIGSSYRSIDSIRDIEEYNTDIETNKTTISINNNYSVEGISREGQFINTNDSLVSEKEISERVNDSENDPVIREWGYGDRLKSSRGARSLYHNQLKAERASSHNRTIDTKNIAHNYNEAYINGQAAKKLQEFNQYAVDVERELGISGSMINMATTTTNSVITGAVAGTAVPGIGSAVGAAAGIVSSGVSIVSGFAKIDIESDGHELQKMRNVINNALISGWAEVKTGTGITFTYPGVETAFTVKPGTKSTFKELTEKRRDFDSEIRDLIKTYDEHEIAEDDVVYFGNIKILHEYTAENINQSYETNTAINTRSRKNSKSISDMNKETSENIRDTTAIQKEYVYSHSHVTSKDILDKEKINERDKIDLDYDFSDDINTRNFNKEELDLTETERVTRQGFDLEENILEENYSNDYKKINNDYSKMRNSLIAETNQSRHGAPYIFGAASSENPNVFGQFGLEVSVERISKAAERDVANTFRKYGYRLPGTMVERPVLGQMSDFTYWECQDAWIVAPQLADSLALIIKNMFMDGVTLWENPDLVRLTPVGDNK